MIMRIQELREAAGITQVQLALRMGISQGTVSQWENEIVLPKSRDLPQLANVLQCSIDALYNREDEDAVEYDPA